MIKGYGYWLNVLLSYHQRATATSRARVGTVMHQRGRSDLHPRSMIVFSLVKTEIYWRVVEVYSDGVGGWTLSPGTRNCYSDWLFRQLHAAGSHCLPTSWWILVPGGILFSKLLRLATNHVRIHDLHVLSLCSWWYVAVALTNYRSPHFDVS